MHWQFADTPSDDDKSNPVELVLSPRAKSIGAFDVKRALPSRHKQMIGPFIFFDQMGPTVFSGDTAMDVRPHPHIGISTITWLFEGEIQHKDSLGFDITIRPGEVNWMTAGSGIVHSERSPQSQRNMNAPLGGIQSWVALPIDSEEIAPAFYHYSTDQIPHYDDDGLQISLIVGCAFGQTSPVITQSPTLYAEINLSSGKSLVIPDIAEERGIYIYQGELEIAGSTYTQGSMLVLGSAREVEILASQTSKLMLLGGDAMEGPRHIYWNFVSSRKERISQAKDEWRKGLFAGVAGDKEYIPLPEDEE
ncbi:MAG: pirin family protein [Gammaproteobacteria bacterium]|jgi:redox-sensitive bicupin YhaK (pirin superfamily)|nr:pirin family protein [Gammaproteobacteria bacterium]